MHNCSGRPYSAQGCSDELPCLDARMPRLLKRSYYASGRLLRYAGAGVVARAITPATTIRVCLSHFVRAEDVAHYGRLVSMMRTRRRMIAPSELFDYYTQPAPSLCGEFLLMSFDDGLLSSFTATQQVLNPLGIKAIFFVPTAILELRGPDDMRQFYWERVYRKRRPLAGLRPEEYVAMTADHLRELSRQGHSIMPHTHSHMHLSQITSPALVEQELTRPRRLLEDLVDQAAPGFAFPVGSERVISAQAYRSIRKIYSFCFTGLNGMNSERTDPFYLHRDPIHAHDTCEHTATVMGGAYDLYYWTKMRRLKQRAATSSDQLDDDAQSHCPHE